MEFTDLKQGDLVFTLIPHPIFKKVAEGTNSQTNHVGIIFKDDDNNWVVAESTVPVVKYSSLEKFVNRSENGWYCIRRLKSELSKDNIIALKNEVDKHLGQFYHFGFKYNSNHRQFCSKLVYDTFYNALGLKIGKLQTFKSLLTEQPNTSLTFWRLWYFGFIPWKRVTVTPASQMVDDQLNTLYNKPTES